LTDFVIHNQNLVQNFEIISESGQESEMKRIFGAYA
jgi:hypothetical protein